MKKILLIEDSLLTRKILSKTLTSMGYEVDQAETGEKGLAEMEKKTYDCVFLDLLMPGMDGFDVMEVLKANGNEVPVMVITSDIQETSKKRSLELGAVDFVNKPIFRNKEKLTELFDKVFNENSDENFSD